MDVNARLVYGVGVLALGVGNVLYGIGQFSIGRTSLIAVLVVIMGVTMTGIGGLIVSDSDRISAPPLSDTVLLVVGVVGLLFGLFLTLGSVSLLLF